MNPWGAVAQAVVAAAKWAAEFSRKRPKGQEDHWFPRDPDAHGLRPGQCFYCKRFYFAPRPKRGCPGVRNGREAELP